MTAFTKEIALVLAEDGPDIWIEPKAKSGCQSCDAKTVCGTGLLSQVMKRVSFVEKIANTVSAKAGDQVLIGIPNQGLILAGLVLYWTPLFALLIAAILAQILNWAEIWIILSAITGLILGILLGRAGASWIEKRNIARIILLGRLDRNMQLHTT